MIITFLRTFIILTSMNMLLCAHAPLTSKEKFNELVGRSQKFADTDIKKSFNKLKKIISDASDIAKNSNQTNETKKQFAQVMTNSLAIPHIAKFSLGLNFKEYYPEKFQQFEQFITQLSSYLLKIYATEEKIKVFGSIDMKEDDISSTPELNERGDRLTYKAVFESDNGPLKTQFILIKINKEQYKILDISVEGLGLLSNLRSQISGLFSGKTPETFLETFSKHS